MTEAQQTTVDFFLASDAAKAKIRKVFASELTPALFYTRTTGELYIASLEGALPDGRTICVLDEDGDIDWSLSHEWLTSNN